MTSPLGVRSSHDVDVDAAVAGCRSRTRSVTLDGSAPWAGAGIDRAEHRPLPIHALSGHAGATAPLHDDQQHGRRDAGERFHARLSRKEITVSVPPQSPRETVLTDVM